jgi:hypothetical protein
MQASDLYQVTCCDSSSDSNQALAWAAAAERRAKEAEARADEAETDAAEMRARLHLTEAQVSRLEHDMAGAEMIAAETARVAKAQRLAEQRRKGQGRWQRLRAAWRGE